MPQLLKGTLDMKKILELLRSFLTMDLSFIYRVH